MNGEVVIDPVATGDKLNEDHAEIFAASGHRNRC